MLLEMYGEAIYKCEWIGFFCIDIPIENNKENRVVLYKELLHNPYIMEKCMALGCVCIDDFNDIKGGEHMSNCSRRRF